MNRKVNHIHIDESELHHVFFAATVLRFRELGWNKEKVQGQTEAIVTYLQANEERFREEAVTYLETYNDPKDMFRSVLPAYYAIQAAKFVDKVTKFDIAQWN